MNYDEQIQEKQSQKDLIVGKMEAKKQEILDEFTTFIKDWYSKKTISTIKEKSDKILALGDEKARELKSKATALIDNADETVNRHLNKDEIWWHKKENSISYYPMDHKIIAELDENSRYVLGELGQLLSDYGIVNENYSTQNEWSKEYGRSRMKFKFGVGFSKELIGLSNDYVNLINECRLINVDLKEIEDEKRKDNIEDYWSNL